MGITYVPPRNNKAKNIKIDDINDNFQSKDVEGALKELAENKTDVIDNANVSDTKTYSNKKIEEKFNNVSTQIKENEKNFNEQLDNIEYKKISKGEGGIITNAMLSQEVKESMTGGSVAVVGDDGVCSNNIVSKSITQALLSDGLREQLTTISKIPYTLSETKGYYDNNLSYIENANYTTTEPIECYLGEEFIANQCVNGSSAYYVCLLGNDKQPIEVIGKGDGSSTASERTYKINNANARYITFTTSTGRVSSFYVKRINVKDINKNISATIEMVGNIKSILSEFRNIAYTENTTNGYYDAKGVLVPTASSTSYRNTELIECSYGDEFEFQSYGIGNAAYQVVEFDENKLPLGAYLQGTGANNSYSTKRHKVINLEIKYIAFSYYVGDLILNKKELIDKIHSNDTQINDILTGKTIVGIGDSLMYGMGLGRDKPWLALLGKKYNMNYFNCGVNGKKVAGTDGMANEFETLLTKNSVPDEVDYIVVDGGANDNANGIKVGTNDDTTVDTFKGAMNVIIGKILDKFPTAKILFLTNYSRYAGDVNFVDAMIEICELYSIPCFDNYRKSGINFYNPNNYHTKRNLVFENQTYKKHFSEKGYEYLLPIYENLLKGI